MNDMNRVYREMHNLVRHGQKQGFAAGVIFSVGALALSKARKMRTPRTHVPYNDGSST